MQEHTLALAKKIQEKHHLAEMPIIELVDDYCKTGKTGLVITYIEIVEKPINIKKSFGKYNWMLGEDKLVVLSGAENIKFIKEYDSNPEKIYAEFKMDYKCYQLELEKEKASPSIAPKAVFHSLFQERPPSQIGLLAKNLQEMHQLKELPSVRLKEAESYEVLTPQLRITLHKDDAAAIDRIGGGFLSRIEGKTIILDGRETLGFIEDCKVDARKLYQQSMMSTYYSGLVAKK
jgi:hypothetical protein